jgi:PAS domain S-box-containing protein
MGVPAPSSLPRAWRGLAVGILSLAVLTLVKLPFAAYIGRPTPFLLYFGAVLCSAWFGGNAAGLITTLLAGLLGNVLFISPSLRPSLSIGAIAQLLLFTLEGLLITLLTTRLQSERSQAAAAQERARISLEWFRTALRSIGDAVVTTDRTGRITFLNPVAEELTGWKTEQAAGRPLSDIFRIYNEASRKPIESPVDRVLREGRIVGLANHTIRVRRDGSEIAIDDSAVPIKTDSGALVGVVLVFRNVSRERRLRAEVAAQRDQLKALIMAAPIGICVLRGPELVIELMNEPHRKRFGEAEHLGRSLLELNIDEANTAMLRRVFETGEPAAGVEVPATADYAGGRQTRYITYSVQPLRDADGQVERIVLFVSDVTEQLTARHRLEAARSEAELASRVKDEFLAMLGHELRNPLAPIVTALQLMNMQAGSAFARERSIIERQVKHMVRMVDDLLDISRITRGKVELARQSVDIAEIVTKAIEMASPLIEQRRHEVTTAATSGLFVEGDPVRLAQVVANLLNNAAKYTNKGGHLFIGAERSGDQIVLKVRDDGMGMAPDMLPHIFDLFVQERQALDRAQGGLGLGLSIVRSLVALHGGCVEAHSEGLGRGSEFTVRLPAIAAPAPSRASEPRPADTAPRAAGERLLVVDDNADALEVLCESLERLGYKTMRASDGPSALVLAAKAARDEDEAPGADAHARAGADGDGDARQRPTVGLLDIGLPLMDGYELARRLREVSGLEDIKLIAITGYGQSADRERSAAAGFDAHLVKPVSLEAVQKALERLRGARTSPNT